MFFFVLEASRKSHDNAMTAAAMSNLAIVEMRQDNFKDALKHSRGAVELLQRTYAKRCVEVSDSNCRDHCTVPPVQEHSTACASLLTFITTSILGPTSSAGCGLHLS